MLRYLLPFLIIPFALPAFASPKPQPTPPYDHSVAPANLSPSQQYQWDRLVRQSGSGQFGSGQSVLRGADRIQQDYHRIMREANPNPNTSRFGPLREVQPVTPVPDQSNGLIIGGVGLVAARFLFRG